MRSDLGRNTPGIAQHDAEPQIDMKRMRAYRLARVQEQLKKRDLAGVILYDPINVRYANGSSNMQVWILHNQARYCFVPAEGPTVLFEYKASMHLSEHLETIGEIRPCIGWTYFGADERFAEKANLWAQDMDDAIRQTMGTGNKRIAADHLDPRARRKWRSWAMRSTTASRSWSSPARSNRRRNRLHDDRDFGLRGRHGEDV